MCSEKIWHRKFSCIRVSRFCRTFFVSQYRKTSWGNPLCFRKILLSKIFMLKRGLHDFPSNISCLTRENFCRGTLLCFRKCLVVKIFMHKRQGRGVSQFFVALLELNDLGKCWDLNPYPALQNLVVLPLVPW